MILKILKRTSDDRELSGQTLSGQCMSVLAGHKSNTCTRQARLREVIDRAPATPVTFRCLVFNQTHLNTSNAASKAVIEDCTKVETYWYFSGSEIPFGVTLGLEVFTVLGRFN